MITLLFRPVLLVGSEEVGFEPTTWRLKGDNHRSGGSYKQVMDDGVIPLYQLSYPSVVIC